MHGAEMLTESDKDHAVRGPVHRRVMAPVERDAGDLMAAAQAQRAAGRERACSDTRRHVARRCAVERPAQSVLGRDPSRLIAGRSFVSAVDTEHIHQQRDALLNRERVEFLARHRGAGVVILAPQVEIRGDLFVGVAAHGVSPFARCGVQPMTINVRMLRTFVKASCKHFCNVEKRHNA